MIRVTVDDSLTAMLSEGRLVVLNGILLPGSAANTAVTLPQPDGTVIDYDPQNPTSESLHALLTHLHPTSEIAVIEPLPPASAVETTAELPILPALPVQQLA